MWCSLEGMTRPLTATLLCLFLGLAWADSPVRIGSKANSESVLLAELMAQTIERSGAVQVERMYNLGGTRICFGALKSGVIDLYPEYTGSGFVFLGGSPPRDALEAYTRVQTLLETSHRATLLYPFGFEDTYVLVMPRSKARRLKIRTISDLVAHGDLRGAFSNEFFLRQDGYPGLQRTYGLKLASATSLEPDQAWKALDSDDVDLLETYSTDPRLLTREVEVLTDDLEFFPPYHAVPLIRLEALERHPSLRPLFRKLALSLDETTVQELLVRFEGGEPLYKLVSQHLDLSPQGFPRVVIKTSLGDIEVELNARRAPVTTRNFLRYVKAGHYREGRFHRTVTPHNQPDNKVKIEVIQAGPRPGTEDFAPVPLERTRETGLSHRHGVISMARLGPDTATSDFFICVGAQPELDFGGQRNPDGQGFAAFGRVVEGMDVVRAIQQSPADGQSLAPPVTIYNILPLR